jgi:hypothetical protein
MVAPVPAHIAKLPHRRLLCSSRCSGSNSLPVNLLRPLFPCSVAPVLCFQQLAASFPKTPGWGVPRFSLQPPTAHYPLLTTHSPLTTFRVNTCKTVSKEITLTTFRMNTYEKRGEGGIRHFRLSKVQPPVSGLQNDMRHVTPLSLAALDCAYFLSPRRCVFPVHYPRLTRPLLTPAI